ncbi:prolyl oligopeptidase family serine peptidase, partial [bacterium]|nr:prolyl oligopeptidase family serine peptidase [bacterium]
MGRVGRICSLLIGLAVLARGAEPPLEPQALAAMKKATATFTAHVSTRGGYLWRYSEDLSRREGEVKATATQVWVQPPGTPAVGLAYVRAYQATGDRQFLDAAVAAARALVFGQLWSGGWAYHIDFAPPTDERRLAYRHLPRPKSKKVRVHSVLDDNTTQAALRCLMAVDARTGDKAVHEAARYGLDALLRAQLPKGGWPQVFGQPPPEQKLTPFVRIEPDGSRTTHQRPIRYWHYYTFNDGVLTDCVATCLDAYERYKDERYLDAVRKAGDFIVLAQLAPPQAGWAQQYTPDLKPEWARRFEPPAACSLVTYHTIGSLINIWLATGDAKYLKPIPAALDWLERSRLPGDRPRWARFYELGSNRPLYFVKDTYELTYKADNLPTHYTFISTGDLHGKAKARYGRALKDRRKAILARLRRLPAAAEQRKAAKALEPKVRRVIAALDAQGRWVEGGWISCRTFNRNLRTLADYVAAVRTSGEPRVVKIPSSKDGAEQPAMLYIPEAAEAVPLVVALHTWSAGYTQTDPWLKILAECQRRGFAAIHPHFRGPNKRPEACASPLAVQDVLDAVAYARERARIDDRRIYLVGASGGGHMAMMMAARAPKLWAAVSAWVGISDLAAWHAECKAAGRHYYKDIEGACGGPPGPATEAEYRRRSPLLHLAAAKGLPLDLNAGIHDGHTGSVPVSHTLRAFNVLAPGQPLADGHIAFIVQHRALPDALAAERDDDAARQHRVL